jgi:hypothetical protein
MIYTVRTDCDSTFGSQRHEQVKSSSQYFKIATAWLIGLGEQPYGQLTTFASLAILIPRLVKEQPETLSSNNTAPRRT